MTRYQAELDRIADAALEAGATATPEPLQPIIDLGRAIAECAVRNRAALLLTFYEPPSGSGDELAQVAGHTPDRVVAAMHELLRQASRRGALRKGIDLDVLADRICQSMLHIGIGVYHRKRGAERVPALKCEMLLQGLAVQAPPDRALDRSPARQAADEVIARWDEDDHTADQAAFIRSVARAEFGRRGYSATTIRDVAAAAGVRPGNLYRVVESKEQLLGMVLSHYVESVTDGWDTVLRSKATPIEKLDASAVDRHQRPRSLQRRAQDPVGLDAVRAPDLPRPRLVVPHTAAPDASRAGRRRPDRRDQPHRPVGRDAGPRRLLVDLDAGEHRARPGGRRRPQVRPGHAPAGRGDLLCCRPLMSGHDRRTGSRSQPRTLDVWAMWARSRSISQEVQRLRISSRATRPSMRARAAPRQ